MKVEAVNGFEPMDRGFADLCLTSLATPPQNSKIISNNYYVKNFLLFYTFYPFLSISECKSQRDFKGFYAGKKIIYIFYCTN